MNLHARRSGILLHPTSLPGPFGIGDLGPEAYRFADFLAGAGQSLWQVLPLGPTGYGNSPYMSFSAFGGNPLLISPERLVDEGLLDPAQIRPNLPLAAGRVDFPAVVEFKWGLFEKAFERFVADPVRHQATEYFTFCEQNAFWLEEYALFMALKDAHRGRIWCDWDPGAAKRDPGELVKWRNQLIGPVQFQKFLQYTFFRQWTALTEYCHHKNIEVIGDVPIYVAYDSADVWAHPEYFRLEESGKPVVIAGVPPDYFSATGQRWGNPIYKWEVMAGNGYDWWFERFRANLTLVDLVRLDHFRGFEAYWEIPAAEETAVNGRWVKGPGAGLFASVRDRLSSLGIPFRVIAEDLGVITPEVDKLRDDLGFPGMRILQMAFGSDPKASEYLPHNHVRNSVVYTATHDHNTTVGWFTAQPGAQTTQSADEVASERAHALEYTDCTPEQIHWGLIRLAMSSVAAMAIVPVQDLLGLGTGSRMNLPGTLSGNWEWRLQKDQLTPEAAARLADLTRIYERGT